MTTEHWAKLANKEGDEFIVAIPNADRNDIPKGGVSSWWRSHLCHVLVALSAMPGAWMGRSWPPLTRARLCRVRVCKEAYLDNICLIYIPIIRHSEKIGE